LNWTVAAALPTVAETFAGVLDGRQRHLLRHRSGQLHGPLIQLFGVLHARFEPADMRQFVHLGDECIEVLSVFNQPASREIFAERVLRRQPVRGRAVRRG
jgi:hypothetical protein